jgi:hypothetical protein
MITIKKTIGFAAVAGLLVLAAPVERASAMSLATPGIAVAVQGETAPAATEVHWRRGWHRHHRWHRHHHWRRHHWRHRHW